MFGGQALRTPLDFMRARVDLRSDLAGEGMVGRGQTVKRQIPVNVTLPKLRAPCFNKTTHFKATRRTFFKPNIHAFTRRVDRMNKTGSFNKTQTMWRSHVFDIGLIETNSEWRERGSEKSHPRSEIGRTFRSYPPDS